MFAGGHAGIVHRDHGRAQLARGGGQVLDALRAGDPLAQEERRAGLHGDQVEILDDAEDLAGGRDDREMAEAAIEHVEQHLAAQPVGRAGVGRRGHRGRNRSVPGEPTGQDSRRAGHDR